MDPTITTDEAARDLVFCYFGLRRCRDRLERIVALVPDPRRERLLKCIAQASEFSARDLEERLDRIRESNAAAQFERAAAVGFPGAKERTLRELPPALRRWISRQECDGRTDH